MPAERPARRPGRKIAIISKREYLSRVKTKGFILSTVGLPLLMAAMLVLPSLILAKSKSRLDLVVVDATGRLAPALEQELASLPAGGPDPQVELEVEVLAASGDAAAQQAALDQRIVGEEIDGWLWISEQGLEENRLLYHGRNVSNVLTLEILEDNLSEIVRRDRIAAAGYDVDELGKLTAPVQLETRRVSEKGVEEDAGWGDLAIAIGLFFSLYLSMLVYGQMVMNGVLEEKSNRVVEVVVSTVKPFELMAGKLLGIGAVSLTQLAIWVASAAALTAPGLVAAVVAFPDGLPTLDPVIIAHFFALFLLGYTLYASFYALVGAAFNNPQEAQQLASFGVIFIVAPVMVIMPVLNDPAGPLAVGMSLVPLFTPLVMTLRIAVQMPPAWQLVFAYVATIAFDVFMVWLCARVYRVGILMYGKKPTLKELWKWVRYA